MIAPVPSLQAPSASISERKRPDSEAATGLRHLKRYLVENALCADVPGYDDLGLKSPWGKRGVISSKAVSGQCPDRRRSDTMQPARLQIALRCPSGEFYLGQPLGTSLDHTQALRGSLLGDP
jgi:hypothetical protein